MSDPKISTVDINGHACRVWTKGAGPKIGWLAGFGGLPRWMPFLDELAKSRTVIVPSMPGMPGATGHTVLDTHLDWIVAIRQLVVKAGLDGADLAGSSVGGSFVLELAAMWPQSVRRAIAIAPFGMFDEKDPATDPWAQRSDAVAGLMCADPQIWKDMKAVPDGANSVEWPIEQARAAEASARIFWPLGNTKLEKRLPLVTSPTLLLWGEKDQIMPRSYAAKIAKGLTSKSEIKTISGAGHLAELDAPALVAKAIVDWTA